ncbi:aminotransferase [Algoriphagus aquimarinus]|uniref:Aminotransferase n=1 Tax=Algoriphagus aquimarinus TaxID=237018 RepID=A0A5C7AWT5_9BACT|nr:aminotransferase [Algoriphagus aquimarinus]
MQSPKQTTFKIESTSLKGDFKVSENGRKILELKYKNWYSGIAETYLDREKIQLKPKNWWSGKIEIFKDSRKVGEITHNSKLHLSITIENKDQIEKTYVLKSSGNWKIKFEVSSDSGEKVMILTPVNSWKKLNFDVQVLDENLPLEELMIYSAYACKLYYAYVSGG